LHDELFGGHRARRYDDRPGWRTARETASPKSRKTLWVLGAGIATCAVLVVGIIAANGNSSADGNSAASLPGDAARHCYYSVQDMLGGNPFTVAISGVSDCTNYAVGNSEFFVQKVNVSKGAGNAICMGEDRGQVGTVITTPDNYAAGEAYCESAGWTDLPNGN
jgi:hypothetical protein